MADQLQLRGGTTNEHSTFTGALREVTVDTDKDTLIVHDAATAGGHPLLREDGSNSALSLGTAGTPSIKFTGDTNTGIYSPGADQVAISTGGTARLYIDSTGKVSLGTISPVGNFVVSNGGAQGLEIFHSSVNNAPSLQSYNRSTSAFTQLSFNSLNYKFRVSDSDAVEIDSSGRLLVGTSSARSNINSGAKTLQIETAVNNVSTGLSVVNNSSTGWTSRIALGMTGGTAVGSNTIVSSGNSLGALSWVGADGTNLIEAGRIQTQVDGTPGTNDMPGRLVFYTTADGASSPTERMRIDSSGRVFFGDSTSDLNHKYIFSGNETTNVAAFQYNNNSGTYITIEPGAANEPVTIDASARTGPHCPIAINTGGSESLRIDSSGRVGVGTSSPDATLHISKSLTDGDTLLRIQPTSFSAGYSVRQAFTRGSTDLVRFTVTSDASNADKGSLLISTSSTTSTTNPVAVFTGDGRVGVGTTSPGVKLHVSGTNDASIRVANTLNNTPSGNHLELLNNSSDGLKFNVGRSGVGGNSSLTYDNNFNINAGATGVATFDSSGRVGIGTSSPTTISTGNTNLTLGPGSSGSQGSEIHMESATHNGSGNGANISYIGSDLYVVNRESGFLGLYTNGADRVHIDSSGNVGIGTTSPQNSLSIGSTGSFGEDANSFYLGSNFTGTGQNYIASSKHAQRLFFNNSSANGYLSYSNTGGTGTAGSAIAWQERFRVDSSGRLLVGTSSASISDKFIVYGNANNNDEAFATLSRGTGPTDGQNLGVLAFSQNVDRIGARILAQRDGGSWSGSSHPTRLMFQTTPDGSTSPTERMRITSAGNVGINVTPTAKLEAKEDTSSAETVVFRIISNWSSSGQTQMLVLSDGDVENRNNAYRAISDAKLKENIADANSQWEDIKSLRVRNYNFIKGAGDPSKKHIGLIAQETELVSPGLVAERADQDNEGNDLGTTTKSVNYSVLYMKAVKALQEAMERIETLEAKVAALEAN